MLLVQPETSKYKTKKHPQGMFFVLIWWQITHKNYNFCGTRLLVGLSPRFSSNQKHQSIKQKNTHKGCFFVLIWWPWSDSNRHSLQNLILSQARLPIPPRGQNRPHKLFCDCFRFDLFYQACAAVWFVGSLFRWCGRFSLLFFNGFFDCCHFVGQT